jgi:Mg-chelatase subunit ChlD
MNEAVQPSLTEFDYIVVVDKSGSMGEKDMKGRSRWDYMQESVVAFARELEAIDSDGIGLILFSGNGIVTKDGVGADAVKEAFASNKPGGSTPLAEALEEALKLAGKSDKKDYILVFTDGVPDNAQQVKDLITKKANAQTNDDDCTIQFVQVGYDKGATEYLKDLDTGIKAKWDIVNAITIDEADKFPTISAMILAGING